MRRTDDCWAPLATQPLHKIFLSRLARMLLPIPGPPHLTSNDWGWNGAGLGQWFKIPSVHEVVEGHLLKGLKLRTQKRQALVVGGWRGVWV